MASDDLTDEERELLAKHRASKKPSRSVRIRGSHDSGAEYEFDIDGDDAERVISRHSELWADAQEDDDDSGGKPVKAVKDAEPRRFGGRRVS